MNKRSRSCVWILAVMLSVGSVVYGQISLPASGGINTVAGTGVAGYNGDGEAATGAELYYPTGVALDAAGNIGSWRESGKVCVLRGFLKSDELGSRGGQPLRF